jgi:hypothetical protein
MLSRRDFLTSALASLALAGPAMAQTDRVTRGVVQQLERQGFTITEIRRTLLGRVRIAAQRGSITRELVLDPRNGAILRDLVSRGGESVGVPYIGDYDEREYDDDDGDDDDDDDSDDDDDDDDSDDDNGGNDDDDDGGGNDDDDD